MTKLFGSSSSEVRAISNFRWGRGSRVVGGCGACHHHCGLHCGRRHWSRHKAPRLHRHHAPLHHCSSSRRCAKPHRLRLHAHHHRLLPLHLAVAHGAVVLPALLFQHLVLEIFVFPVFLHNPGVEGRCQHLHDQATVQDDVARRTTCIVAGGDEKKGPISQRIQLIDNHDPVEERGQQHERRASRDAALADKLVLWVGLPRCVIIQEVDTHSCNDCIKGNSDDEDNSSQIRILQPAAHAGPYSLHDGSAEVHIDILNVMFPVKRVAKLFVIGPLFLRVFCLLEWVALVHPHFSAQPTTTRRKGHKGRVSPHLGHRDRGAEEEILSLVHG
mmetsp:Transcript_30571/g.46150  ORF Transcript_30571/g.46150 Transcript_30571/m.46150 type:complete len:329 (+) Transcript_30571:241-1227(+)